MVERLAGISLLLVMVPAIFPMEQPGMLGNWCGVQPNIIFTAKFLKLTIVEVVVGMALVMSYLYYVSVRRVKYQNHSGLVLILFVVCIVWGYIGTVFGDKVFTTDNPGIANWKRIVYGVLFFVSLTHHY